MKARRRLGGPGRSWHSRSGCVGVAILGLAHVIGLTPAIDAGPLPSPATTPAIVRPSDSIPPEMELSPLPRIAPSPHANPASPEKVELGRLLFFDPILSVTRDVACATCHHPAWGWADGRATPIGVGGAGGVGPQRIISSEAPETVLRRNVPSVLNTAFNGWTRDVLVDPDAAPFFWDSRVRGLERQALVPIGSSGEMATQRCRDDDAVAAALRRVAAVPEYQRRFRRAFPEARDPGATVTSERVAQAIAAFERSLITPDAPIDRYLAGQLNALSPLQREGLRIFRRAGCQHCHGGPMFSDFKPHAIGRPSAPGEPEFAFRTPTLRNLRDTAPYMHDGSLRTLRDVLAFYDALGEAATESLDGGAPPGAEPLDPLLRHLNLQADDFPALEALFEALSSDRYDRIVPASVPSQLRVPTAMPNGTQRAN